ncbi:hypothetical protein BC941DRAFT_508668, partial [Chlamydoabsidia padenii]
LTFYSSSFFFCTLPHILLVYLLFFNVPFYQPKTTEYSSLPSIPRLLCLLRS